MRTRQRQRTWGRKNISAVEGRTMLPVPAPHSPAMTRSSEDLPVPLLPTMSSLPPGGSRSDTSRA